MYLPHSGDWLALAWMSGNFPSDSLAKDLAQRTESIARVEDRARIIVPLSGSCTNYKQADNNADLRGLYPSVDEKSLPKSSICVVICPVSS